jgi:CyaY protein
MKCNKIKMTMYHNNYPNIDEIINKIADIIELADVDCKFDIDINNNVLSIKTNNGVYIINKQSALEEIWLSSPVSGPYHFAYKNDSWLSKNDYNLYQILQDELEIEVRI